MRMPTIRAPKQVTLNEHLFRHAGIDPDLRHLIVDVSRAVRAVSYAIQTTEAGLAGSRNEYGEDQLKLDVLSNDIVRRYLSEGNLVCCYVSEEQKEIIDLSDDAPYCVVFDPLDGSSLVEADFAIGSIFGIYKGPAVIGRKPRDQVAALYALYGPRTVLVYSTGQGVHEFVLHDVGEFVLLREHLGVADEAKNYSPGNLHAIGDNAGYRRAYQRWTGGNMTLRYSGCMVADVHHILSKGQGIFTNVSGGKYPQGKLRHVFECGPFAFLMEQAGGAASDGSVPLLDKAITGADQRTPIVIGSKNEVERTCGDLRGEQ